MKTYPYLDKIPKIKERVFMAPGAKVIGDVTLENDVNVWFNTVIRGDVNHIKIGENTNVQDLSMLHVTEENSLEIGKNVTIGHSVILHACKVGDSCLIGMGSIVLDGAEIGNNSLVAAGSLVTPGKKFPDNSFIKGRPAERVRDLNPNELNGYGNHYKSYVGYKDLYLDDENYLSS